jgi:medium-chain acyl-[acyl-carrier-protein] hydrolase
VEPFEALLTGLVARPKLPARHLSEDRRRLLALRLKQKATPGSKWFPGIEAGDFRLFCFPHAGGGTLMYRSWRDRLSPLAAVVPVCLPGREQRFEEPPIEDLDALVLALASAILPHLEVPFAFFGHSMGAAIAFELTRALAGSGAPLPAALVVSAARAPQFRERHTPPPDPGEAEFLAELRRLEGVPPELLEHPEALRVLLPALQGDARMYRRWIYRRSPPLDIPIFAYAGSADPNVRPEHVEPWRDMTTGRFTRREFEGGHFYLQSHREAFLGALTADLATLRAG